MSKSKIRLFPVSPCSAIPLEITPDTRPLIAGNRLLVIVARRDAGLKDVASQNAVFSPGIAILKIKVGQTSKKDARASGKPLADV